MHAHTHTHVHSCRWADLSEFVLANVCTYMKWTEVGNGSLHMSLWLLPNVYSEAGPLTSTLVSVKVAIFI